MGYDNYLIELEEILSEKPKLHGSPEMRVSWGISDSLARFIHETVKESDTTLETGGGISTLVFALRRARHTVVSPDANEREAITKYASERNISLETVNFATETSESYLPRVANDGRLDFVD